MQRHAQKKLYLALTMALLAPAAYFSMSGSAIAATLSGATHVASHNVPSSALVNVSEQQVVAQSTTQSKKLKKKRGQSIPQATKLKAITVIGYRQSIDSALDEQRHSNAVVDVINAQNISQFPAKDVAGALAHLPGVVITRDGGQGHTVSVRGLAPNLTLTELNGNNIASAEEDGGLTRSFNYLMMPAALIASVKLYKSQQASLDAGGIGGTVIMHTRRPLNLPANKSFIKLTGAELDTRHKLDPQATALYSWHNTESTFGVLLAGSFEKRNLLNQSANNENWGWWTNHLGTQPPVNINGKPFPNESDIYIEPTGSDIVDQSGKRYSGYWEAPQFILDQQYESRYRTGAQLTLQFKPSNNFLLTGNYFRFQLKDDNQEHTFEIPVWALPTGPFSAEQGRQLAPNGLTFDRSHSIVTGQKYILPVNEGCAALTNPVTGVARQPLNVCSEQIPRIGGDYVKQQVKSQSLNIKGEWSSSILSGSFNVGRTWSDGGPSVVFTSGIKPRKFVNGRWVNGNHLAEWSILGKPSAKVGADTLTNLRNGIGQIDLGDTGNGGNHSKEAQNYAQLDFTTEFGPNWLTSLQFGFKYKDTHVSKTSQQVQWNCPGTETEFQQCGENAGLLMRDYVEPTSLATQTKAFTTNVYPSWNYPVYYAFLNKTYGPATRTNFPQNFSGLKEQDLSAYIQLNYAIGRARGNFGVRLVRTQQDLDNGSVITTDNQFYYHDAHGNILFCPGSGVNISGGPCVPGDFQYRPENLISVRSVGHTKSSRTYTEALPSFNFVYRLPHNVLLRFAAAKAMARPNYSSLAVNGSLTHITPAYYHDRRQFGSQQPGWYGSGGNSGLKQFDSRQFDLGAAWYPVNGAVLGLDYFHDRVKNFVVPVVISQSKQTVNGKAVTVNNFSTIGNGRSGVSKGFEFYSQYTFSWGFGVIANYTLNKTNTTDVLVDGKVVGKSNLVGSAKNAANLSLFYQKHGFLARVTGTRTGTITDAVVSGLQLYSEPFTEVNLHLSYEATTHILVDASVINLTQSTSRTHYGDDTRLRLGTLQYDGRQYYLGVTYNF